MNATTETTVLTNLAKRIEDALEAEIESCKYNERFQSPEVSNDVFQARAYGRYMSVLLKELGMTQGAQLHLIENQKQTIKK